MICYLLTGMLHSFSSQVRMTNSGKGLGSSLQEVRQPLASVAVLEKFLKMGSHSKGSRLFCRIQNTKRGRMHKEEPLSHSRASELIKKELKSEGLDPS